MRLFPNIVGVPRATGRPTATAGRSPFLIQNGDAPVRGVAIVFFFFFVPSHVTWPGKPLPPTSLSRAPDSVRTRRFFSLAVNSPLPDQDTLLPLFSSTITRPRGSEKPGSLSALKP